MKYTLSILIAALALFGLVSAAKAFTQLYLDPTPIYLKNAPAITTPIESFKDTINNIECYIYAQANTSATISCVKL